MGLRPARPEFVEELARKPPFYRVCHAVKPGMAGWALVNYGYASSQGRYHRQTPVRPLLHQALFSLV